jgi:predicted nucleic acid-binding protein
MFFLLPDTPALYPTWERLVIEHKVIGKPAHDARIVAAMLAHRVREILTFDQTGFSRFPDIEVIHPATVQFT